MSLELIFLGTGTSSGVPLIGCECPVCRSDDPRDTRTRPGVLLRYPELGVNGEVPPRHMLIDTTPDLREQALRHDLRRMDAVLYTHAHADHILGIDELRRFNAVMGQPLDIYAEFEVVQRLQSMFSYIFEPQKNINKSFVAQLIPHVLAPGAVLDLFGARWTPIRLMHGRLPVLGFRIDWMGRSLAYCTDCSRVPPASYPLLENLDILVIDALRYRHHPTHMTVDQALDVIAAVEPAEAYLTHITHDVSHAELEAGLPEHVHVPYDGLSIRCQARSAHSDPLERL